MQFAVGVDIEENSRFEDKVSDENFLKRIFTQAEIDYCLSKVNVHEHLAVRFCAKEAVIKALCTFYNEEISIRLNQIEVIKESKIPMVKIHSDKYQDLNFSLSMSHCKSHSIAQVLCSKAIYNA
jgi:phosphopantetheine--protein transferase-like protein